jgi:hypothetical protein
MDKDHKMLSVQDMDKFRKALKDYDGKYVIISDSALMMDLHNLNRAICIMADLGWRPINITSNYEQSQSRTAIYALMEKVGSLRGDLIEDNESNADHKTMEDLTERIPCSDENCTGILNEQGCCGVCGKRGVDNKEAFKQ